jgi:DNA helicase-2/ATP-dependent DNA helicase PcrA
MKPRPGNVLLDLARGADSPFYKSFTGRAALPLADFGGMLAKLARAAQTLTIPELFDASLKTSTSKNTLSTMNRRRRRPLGKRARIKASRDEYSTRTLDEFLENIALIADQDTITDATPHPAHPPRRQGTRIRRGLHRRSRRRHHSAQPLVRRARIKWKKSAASFTSASRAPKTNSISPRHSTRRTRHQSQGQPASVTPAKYRAGTRIKHPSWGEGIVLDSKIQDNDEIVDVVFESVGIKRLSASLANLKII